LLTNQPDQNPLGKKQYQINVLHSIFRVCDTFCTMVYHGFPYGVNAASYTCIFLEIVLTLQ